MSHGMFEFSSKLQVIETFKPVMAGGKLVALDHESIFYDDDAFATPIRAVDRFTRTAAPGVKRFEQFECLTNFRTLDGKLTEIDKSSEFYIDYLNRPWAQNWERFFEKGWDPSEGFVRAGLQALAVAHCRPAHRNRRHVVQETDAQMNNKTKMASKVAAALLAATTLAGPAFGQDGPGGLVTITGFPSRPPSRCRSRANSTTGSFPISRAAAVSPKRPAGQAPTPAAAPAAAPAQAGPGAPPTGPWRQARPPRRRRRSGPRAGRRRNRWPAGLPVRRRRPEPDPQPDLRRPAGGRGAAGEGSVPLEELLRGPRPVVRQALLPMQLPAPGDRHLDRRPHGQDPSGLGRLGRLCDRFPARTDRPAPTPTRPPRRTTTRCWARPKATAAPRSIPRRTFLTGTATTRAILPRPATARPNGCGAS